jgi:fatty acid desaturase
MFPGLDLPRVVLRVVLLLLLLLLLLLVLLAELLVLLLVVLLVVLLVLLPRIFGVRWTRWIPKSSLYETTRNNTMMSSTMSSVPTKFQSP